ncbi:hypothetical protein KAU32_09455 [bacterium]|nr:hypothetical protein [bacterium]
MNRNLLRLFIFAFALLLTVFAVMKIVNEMSARRIWVTEEISNGEYKILSEKGEIIISFSRLLNTRDFRGVAGVYISPDEIQVNPEKIFDILEKSRLPIILLEKISQPDPGELPKYFASLPLIRGHMIPSDEWPKLSDNKRVLRFRRAVIERSVHVIFLPENSAYIRTKLFPYLKGFRMPPQLSLIRSFNFARILERLFLLFAIIAFSLILSYLLSMKRLEMFVLFLVGISLIASYAGGLRVFTNMLSIALVIIFVLYGFNAILQGNMDFFRISAASLLIGLAIYVLHSQPKFACYLLRFRGVKAVFFIPLIIVFFQVVLYIVSEKIEVKRLLPLFSILFLIGLFVILSKSGNWKILPSAFENKLRAVFETGLYARPRFKEFLFGHPLLFLGIRMFKKDKRYVLLLPFGMVGQISLINSYMHFTHPLHVIILSSLWSLLFGIVIGTILYYIIDAVSRGLKRL